MATGIRTRRKEEVELTLTAQIEEVRASGVARDSLVQASRLVRFGEYESTVYTFGSAVGCISISQLLGRGRRRRGRVSSVTFACTVR